jgi:hypothetical protein
MAALVVIEVRHAHFTVGQHFLNVAEALFRHRREPAVREIAPATVRHSTSARSAWVVSRSGFSICR